MPVRIDFYGEPAKIREIGLEKELLDELLTLCLKEDRDERTIERKCYRCNHGNMTIRIKIDSKEEGEYEIAEIEKKAHWMKCIATFTFHCNTCVDFHFVLDGHYIIKEHKEMYKIRPDIDKILSNL